MMTGQWTLTPETRDFLDRQGAMLYWDPESGRGVLVGGQVVGLPPMLFLSPQGRWLDPHMEAVPNWWGTAWDFANVLEPFEHASIAELVQEAREQLYSRPLPEG